MRVRVFFAGTGDCLLISSIEGRHILIDGGPGSSIFDKNILPSLQEISSAQLPVTPLLPNSGVVYRRRSGGLLSGSPLPRLRRPVRQRLDLVVVTHIDDDHIDGILHLLRRSAAQGRRKGTTDLPSIAAIWHKSWSSPSRRKPATRSGPGARRAPNSRVRSLATGLQGLISQVRYSTAQSAEVAWHIAYGVRPIRHNVGFRGNFVERREPPLRRRLSATLSLTVLGPPPEAIDALRQRFVSSGLATKPGRRSAVFTPGSALSALSGDRSSLRAISGAPAAAEPSVRGHRNGTDRRDGRDVADSIGDEVRVTVENRASIILLATEKVKGRTTTCLLTGDAIATDIPEGLAISGRLPPDGTPFRCDVLKVQHHAAEFNFTHDFAERVIARHYVISANGQHKNPDPNVLRLLMQVRADVEPQTPFTIWFTCQAGPRSPEQSRHALADTLSHAIDVAGSLNRQTPGLVTLRVLNGDEPFFDICSCAGPGPDCECTDPTRVTTILVPAQGF